MTIKAIALDIDGVLTDNTFIWNSSGDEFKSFSFLDIMGISIGFKAGLIFALITGEDNILIDRYTKKMNISDVYKGCKDKAKALTSFADKHNFHLEEICYMGDDINDIPALEIAGLSVAPANAHESVKEQVSMITQKPGGHGAVREIIDYILNNKEL